MRRPTPRLALLGSVCALVLATCAPGLIAEGPGRGRGGAEGETLGMGSEHVGVWTIGDAEPRGIPSLPDGEQGTGPRVRSVPAQPDERTEQPQPGTAEVEFSDVASLRPTIRLSGDPSDEAGVVAAAEAVDGVTYATLLRVGRLILGVGDDGLDINVAVVDPDAFRPVTPQVTADALDVWRRIMEGDAAFTHDIGHRLTLDHEIELGERVPLAGSRDSVRIGAYASNGIPPVAEAVVSRATGRELGIGGEATLLVVTGEDAAPGSLVGALEDATGLAAEVIPEPEERRAFLSGSSARSAFEPFSYVSLGDGMIQMDGGWVRRNIVSARVPIFDGEVLCHRLMIPQLRGALQEVVDRGLDHLVKPAQYGGCWVPRHILFNPDRGLSMHAWGLAVDFNVPGNEYGKANPQMDPRIVEVFERWGFVWGGRWAIPDGMHFELGALLTDP